MTKHTISDEVIIKATHVFHSRKDGVKRSSGLTVFETAMKAALESVLPELTSKQTECPGIMAALEANGAILVSVADGQYFELAPETARQLGAELIGLARLAEKWETDGGYSGAMADLDHLVEAFRKACPDNYFLNANYPVKGNGDDE